ncbi:hypothetical protein VN97_g9716 [Penicillium thymicola]|uniref:Uncharacterized protein n=1 Tax=Penicillium thymicola TaxID=293382 RepID=A0AAI9TAV6_PENTH|nr:hypothetical protein VN97_g9716 [Penicillium thymicola]
MMLGAQPMRDVIVPSLYRTTMYNSLPYRDSPTPKLAAKRSANFLQIHFRFTSDSLQIQFTLEVPIPL